MNKTPYKLCDFGCGNVANFIFKSGRQCCSKSCNQCPEMRRKNKIKNKGRKPSANTIKAVKLSNTGRKPWNYGLNKKDIRIKNQSINLSQGLRCGRIKRNYSKKTRKKLSDAAKKRKLGGPTRGGGRGIKGWYKGYWCDSSWELAYIIYNIEHNVKFKRNTRGFKYEFNGELHSYYPDFIEGNKYIEIKGYKSKQFKAKLNNFQYPIRVLMKKDLKYVFDYVINKYGKNYTRLYKKES